MGHKRFGFQHVKIRDPETRKVYLERWKLDLWWFSIRLHHIWREDFGRHLHDHPWWFWSLILRGGYSEILWRDCRLQRIHNKPGTLVRRATTDRHHIDKVFSPCWTFVITGPYTRKWGFWKTRLFADDPLIAQRLAEFVPWDEYDLKGESDRVSQMGV